MTYGLAGALCNTLFGVISRRSILSGGLWPGRRIGTNRRFEYSLPIIHLPLGCESSRHHVTQLSGDMTPNKAPEPTTTALFIFDVLFFHNDF